MTSGRCAPSAAGRTIVIRADMQFTTLGIATSSTLTVFTRIPMRSAAPIRVVHIMRAGTAWEFRTFFWSLMSV